MIIAVLIAIPTVLIAKQPDLGTSLLIAASGVSAAPGGDTPPPDKLAAGIPGWTHVDSVNGDDANDGLTWANAKRSVLNAHLT